MHVPTQRLPIHEWIAVVIIISVFLFLTIITISNYEPPLIETNTVAISQPLVDVTIIGAVKFPGTYQIEKGSTIQTLLDMAEPLPNANLNSLNFDSKITKKRKITIKEIPIRKTRKSSSR